MPSYQNVLAAIDLTEEAPQVLEQARMVASEHGAALSVITVIRPITYAYAGLDASWVSKEMASFETESERYARQRLEELAEVVGVKASDTDVFIGAPAPVIKREAITMGADLIAIGTHGRHGLGLVLGSTANGVLHGAPCDVLAIRIAGSRQ